MAMADSGEQHDPNTDLLPSGGMEGQVVAGKYQLVRLLGQGGMGAVYEGRNLSTLKRCAVKLLLTPELSQNENVVKRFFREAKASSIIESDHIVQIFDSGSDPHTGYPYMVMEMLQGEDLEGTLKRLGSLHPSVSAKLVLQAAIGLAKAHDQHIVHRDIKPANLYLTQRDSGDLVVKLLDFGIAKVKMENFAETSQGLTRTGSMLGTPLYMSPEQAKGASNIDARSDVWSLGVVLYELLSGHLPYEDASSLGELMVSIITADIPLLQDKAPWVPPELAEVTHRAMSRDFNMRYQNAGELRDALAALVPDGPRIVPHELVPVPQEQRAYVAPRLQVTDNGMLKATTRTGLAMTAGGVQQKRSIAAPLIAAGVFSVVVLGVGGGVAYKMLKSEPVAEPQPSTPATVVLSADKEPQITAAEVVRTFNLELDLPEDAKVYIDDEERKVVDDKVEVAGVQGTTVTVKLVQGSEEKEHVIAITENGLIPKKLEMSSPRTKLPPRFTASTKPAVGSTKPAGAPAPAPAPAPKPKPPVNLATGTDEFE